MPEIVEPKLRKAAPSVFLTLDGNVARGGPVALARTVRV
jgi:hypothetical protein